MFLHIKSTSGKWFPTAQPQKECFRLQYPEKNKRNGQWSAKASDLITAFQFEMPRTNNTKIKAERVAL